MVPLRILEVQRRLRTLTVTRSSKLRFPPLVRMSINFGTHLGLPWPWYHLRRKNTVMLPQSRPIMIGTAERTSFWPGQVPTCMSFPSCFTLSSVHNVLLQGHDSGLHLKHFQRLGQEACRTFARYHFQPLPHLPLLRHVSYPVFLVSNIYRYLWLGRVSPQSVSSALLSIWYFDSSATNRREFNGNLSFRQLLCNISFFTFVFHPCLCIAGFSMLLSFGYWVRLTKN